MLPCLCFGFETSIAGSLCSPLPKRPNLAQHKTFFIILIMHFLFQLALLSYLLFRLFWGPHPSVSGVSSTSACHLYTHALFDTSLAICEVIHPFNLPLGPSITLTIVHCSEHSSCRAPIFFGSFRFLLLLGPFHLGFFVHFPFLVYSFAPTSQPTQDSLAMIHCQGFLFPISHFVFSKTSWTINR